MPGADLILEMFAVLSRTRQTGFDIQSLEIVNINAILEIYDIEEDDRVEYMTLILALDEKWLEKQHELRKKEKDADTSSSDKRKTGQHWGK